MVIKFLANPDVLYEGTVRMISEHVVQVTNTALEYFEGGFLVYKNDVMIGDYSSFIYAQDLYGKFSDIENPDVAIEKGQATLKNTLINVEKRLDSLNTKQRVFQSSHDEFEVTLEDFNLKVDRYCDSVTIMELALVEQYEANLDTHGKLDNTELALESQKGEALELLDELTTTQIALTEQYEVNEVLSGELVSTQLALCDVYELLE